MSEESLPAVEPDIPSLPEEEPEPTIDIEAEVGLVTVIYSGEPVHLVGVGDITAGNVTVPAVVARGVANRPDFTRPPRRKRK